MDKKISRHKYPTTASDYLLLEEVGQGVSASVYRASCIPLNDIVAVKVLDLEKCNSSLDEIRREAQTMMLISHPNILSAYCSFVVDHCLWVVMPFMAGGSCLHIMKSGYPDGFEEPVIATILRECLKGLEYLHSHDLIHRDVKAGNILIDSNGVIKLGDFGVSACMFDTGERQRSRNTFVGTPCWMAPEVMEQLYGYDFRADIWSFGITALELAHGHAPFSKYPPMKVLLMTLQNAPPGLDYERDRKFSKAFKKLIAVCLVKDPSKRPTARKLLKHSFFRHARSNDYIVRTILDGLPPLGQRLRDMKLKEADMIAQNKMPFNAKEERSQNEYKRGVSSWNFDIEDLKAQAALIQDDDEPVTNEDASKNSSDESENLEENIDTDSFQSPDMIHTLKDDNAIEDGEVQNFMEDFKEDKDAKICDSKMDRYPAVENGLINVRKDGKELTNKRDSFLQKLEEREMRSLRLPRDARRSSSGPLLAECVLSSYRGQDEDKDQNRTSIQANGGIFQSGVRGQREHTFSGPLNLKGVVEGLEKGGCIRRGRFSITSEDVDLLEDGSPAPQKTAVRQVEASDRELKLLQQVTNLQQKVDKLEAELEVIKHRNLHLEQQLNLRQNRRVNT